MATKIQSLPLAAVFKMVKADLMESYRTHDVQVLTIGLCDRDEFDDDDNEQSIMVMAEVNSSEECFAKDCGVHPWLLTWDEDECAFNYSQRWDQEGDDEDDDDEDDEHYNEMRMLLINYYGTCIGQKVEKSVTEDDVLNAFGVWQEDVEEAKGVLADFRKKMDDARENGTSQEEMAELLDDTIDAMDDYHGNVD